MRFSTNLASRSAILTAFLVASQLLFVVVLTGVLQKAQDRIENEWRSENLIRTTFSSCRTISDLLVYLCMPGDLREFLGVDANAEILIAKRNAETLSKLASVDPLKKAAVEQLSQAHTQIFSMLERFVASGASPSFNCSEAREMHRTLKKNGQKLFDAVEKVVRIEKNRLSASDSYAGTVGTVFTTLLAAVGASILLAVVLGFLYAASIRKPLKHLSSNGRLLSLQKPLLPPLSQEDEFGKLDAILHATSREMDATLSKERETIENAADLICTLSPEGKFVTVNSFAVKVLGIEPEFFYGEYVNSFVRPEQSFFADECLRRAIVSSQVEQFELQLRKADGQFIDSRWSCLWSAAEKQLFCAVRDVTEEKKIERLKQDFADMISHDLRSPLMAMGNSLMLLRSGVKGELPEDARKRIDLSAKNVEKLIVLVNDLLDFQKLKAGKMELDIEPVSLHAIVRDSLELLEEFARESNVTVQLFDDDVVVPCDKNKLTQVAVNLMSNAIKFSGEGGLVTIDVKPGQSAVLLSVTDTGLGVPEGYEQRIFEPFEQAPSEKKKEGTGLGLAICKLVAEAHGGRIYARRRTDRSGSVFTLELPKENMEIDLFGSQEG